MNYQKQAVVFLKNTSTSLTSEFKEHDYYFEGDEERRDVYWITLSNEKHSFKFTFGHSLAKTGLPPTEYEVLSSITKEHPGSFKEFCYEFGFEIERSDMDVLATIYHNVVEEWENVVKLFTPNEIKKLVQIS